MLVGGDFNGDVVSNMDRVFQIVIRSERWLNPPFWGGGGREKLETLLGKEAFLAGGKNLRRNDLHSVNTEHQLKSQLA